MTTRMASIPLVIRILFLERGIILRSGEFYGAQKIIFLLKSALGQQ